MTENLCFYTQNAIFSQPPATQGAGIIFVPSRPVSTGRNAQPTHFHQGCGLVVNDRRVLCPIAKKYTVIELNSIGCVNHRAGSKNQFRNTSRVSEFDVETIYFSLAFHKNQLVFSQC